MPLSAVNQSLHKCIKRVNFGKIILIKAKKIFKFLSFSYIYLGHLVCKMYGMNWPAQNQLQKLTIISILYQTAPLLTYLWKHTQWPMHSCIACDTSYYLISQSRRLDLNSFTKVHDQLYYLQEGYIEELTRFSQCLNAKTGWIKTGWLWLDAITS